MASPLIQASFTAGELSSHLHGRVDLSKYKIGAALMHNFLVDYKGGAGKRAGTRYVGTSRYSGESNVTLLVPFQFNAQQSYVLEFGYGHMRVISNGGYVLTAGGAIYELATPWTDADLPFLKWTQSADRMTFTHPNFYPINLTRYDHNNWVLTYHNIGGSRALPPYQVGLNAVSSGYIDPQSAVYVNYAYGITTVGADGSESLLSPIARLNQVLDMTAHRVTMTINWLGVQGAQYYNVYKASTGVNAQHAFGTRMGFIGSTRSTVLTDSNILPNFTKTPPQHKDPFKAGAIVDAIVTGMGANHAVGDPAYVVDDPTGSGAVVQPVIVYGAVSGFIVEQGGQNYSGTTTDSQGKPATQIIVNGGTVPGTGWAIIGPRAGTFPTAVAYFQQRLLFAATGNNPATLWGSKPGAFDNFDTSIPTDDGDSYEFTLASQQLNAIKYMIGMPGGLVILTAGGAWQLSGTQQFAPVTPTSVMATPQAYNGCADIQPIAIGYEIFFVQTAGSIVRNLSYNFFANIYTGADVTVLSSHLFAGHVIKSWAFAEEPDKVIWVVRDDGILLSFTFLKEQEVSGWAWHETEGQVKSVASIREGNRDVVYLAVRRLVEGQGYRTFIERMMSRRSGIGHEKENVEEAWFLDSALNLPLTFPAGTLYSSTYTPGQQLHLYTNVAMFDKDWVDGIIRMAGGRYQISQFLDAYSVYAVPIIEITETYLYNAYTQDRRMIPQGAGSWSFGWPVTSVSGLNHLEGKRVIVFADGEIHSSKVVSGGAVTLDKPASKVLVGLAYEAKLQTLRLESQPTIQGRRKKIPAVTVRVAGSRGVSAGMTWETLTDIKERPPAQSPNAPLPLINGDMRIVLDPLWAAEGQICIRSTPGLPANILAVIPEAVIGDD